ncbi:putative reverse transcriptase domain-containing protein [Tanacetum coccineum]
MTCYKVVRFRSKLAKPMTKLTQKGMKFDWGKKEEDAFQLLNQKLCSALILALPEGSENFVVYCDASHKGLCAVLMQREKENDSMEKLTRLYLREVVTRLEIAQLLARIIMKLQKRSSKSRSAFKLHMIDKRATPIGDIDDKLNFIDGPVEIMDREVKHLKQSHIPIVKVRWNSRRGPKFTWEREDQMQKKYPHLFANPASTSKATS